MRAQKQGTYDGVWGEDMTSVIAICRNNSLFGLKNAQATESVTREESMFCFRVGYGAIF